MEKQEKKPVESALATEGVTAGDDLKEPEVEVKKEIESTAYVAIVGSILESIVYGLAIGSSWHRNIGFGLSGEFIQFNLTLTLTRKLTPKKTL